MILAATSAGALSAGGLLAYSVFVPRCQFWAPVVRSLPQREAVSLTFDDGPHPEYTPRILDILGERGVKATFFVIGRFAREQGALVKRIAAEGHDLGNHTLDHDHFGINRSAAYWLRQVRETQQIVADLVGMPPMLFRPPMGFKNWRIAAAVREQRLAIVGWSVRAYDTRPMDPAELARRTLRRITGHDIVLLHDGIDPERAGNAGKPASQESTVAALPAIVEGIQEKRLQMVPLVEALVLAAADRREAAERIRARAAT
jgi:peptidoglycan/xylan/chitin deacetylase (PgdA/CDA1 family)